MWQPGGFCVFEVTAAPLLLCPLFWRPVRLIACMTRSRKYEFARSHVHARENRVGATRCFYELLAIEINRYQQSL